MRAFVGLSVDDPVASQIVRLQELLREVIGGQGVRFVRPEKVHLTLQFLGPVPIDDVPGLEAALREALRGAEGFDLQARSLGVFPSARRPGVVWMGLAESPPLVELQARVARATRAIVNPDEDRPYHPHLTLARISPPSRKVGLRLAPMLERYAEQDFGQWRPREVVLYESTPAGEYRRVAEISLSEG
jgi:RNA 2',3'-cyclic 3'-phosphodiesterase